MTLGVIEVMLILLLAVVGSLVIWLHLRLNALSSALKHEKELAKSLDHSLVKAQDAIKGLMEAAQEHAPILQQHIQKAQAVLQDFDYVMGRAEAVMSKADSKITAPQTPEDSIENVRSSLQETLPKQRKLNVVQSSKKASERSVLLGKDLEQVLADKQEALDVQRKHDIRSTFVRAMEERESRIQKQNLSYPDSVEVSNSAELDFLEGAKKTAPRGMGAQAYQSSDPMTEDDIADIRRVLEAH